MSIRKAAWGLGTCVGITLSANVHAIALFHFESVESAVPEFKYHIPRLRMEAGGTGENSNYLSWNRSLDGILPLTPGYLDTLPLLGSFASPSIGSDLPALGGNEAFSVNIAGFTNDEAGVADLLVIPDLFMQAQWQPTESTLPTTPFTLHSYSGNAAWARNTASACMQARNVSGSKSGLRDSDCIEAGSGESGGGANKSGNRVGSGPRSIPVRGGGGGGTVLDAASSGGGAGGASGGGAGGGRDTAAPGTGERGNGVGVPASGSNNSDLDNSSPGSPPAFADTGRTQDNDNNGAGEGSDGGGGAGGNEDWGSGNGDTGNWNNPGEWEGTPPSEVLAIPEPDTLALLALGAAAMRIVRRNRSKPVGSID